MSDNIKVVIKVRPLIKREKNLTPLWKINGNSIRTIENSAEQFSFDHIFDEHASTADLFDAVIKPIVSASVSGINGTIFAYGQTSSGKTHTMMGTESEQGIIGLVVREIFQRIELISDRSFLIRCGYIEIYNEKVFDLLNRNNVDLKIHETPTGDVSVNCKEIITNSEEQILNILLEGNKSRRIGETNMNEHSSRSHTIFRIIIESRYTDPITGEMGEAFKTSSVNLVDLAGSEKADATGASGTRLKEGSHINKSLLSLSLVIQKLSETDSDVAKFINYRDSKLTRILQASIGGNAMTSIICTITPASLEETYYTLSFANRAKAIKNKPKVNNILSDAALMKELECEIKRLRIQLQEECRSREMVRSELEQKIHQREIQFIHSNANSNKDDKQRRKTWCPTTEPNKANNSTPPLNKEKRELTSPCIAIQIGEDRITKTRSLQAPPLSFPSPNKEENFLSSSQWLLNPGASPSPSYAQRFIHTPKCFKKKRTPSISPASVNNDDFCIVLEQELIELQEFTQLEKWCQIKSYEDEINVLKITAEDKEQQLEQYKNRCTELEQKLTKFNELNASNAAMEKLMQKTKEQCELAENIQNSVSYEFELFKKNAKKREKELLLLLDEENNNSAKITSLETKIKRLEEENFILYSNMDKELEKNQIIEKENDGKIDRIKTLQSELEMITNQMGCAENDTRYLTSKIQLIYDIISNTSITKSTKFNDLLSCYNSIKNIVIPNVAGLEEIAEGYSNDHENENQNLLNKKIAELEEQVQNYSKMEKRLQDQQKVNAIVVEEKTKILNEYDELSTQLMDVLQENEEYKNNANKHHDVQDLNEKLRQEIIELREEVLQLTNSNETDEKIILELETLKNEKLFSDSNNIELQEKIKSLSEQCTSYDSEKKSLDEKIKSLTEEINKMSINENEYKTKIDTLLSQISSYQKDVETVDRDESESLKLKITSLEEEITRLANNERLLKNNMQQIHEEQLNLSVHLPELEELEMTAANMEKELSNLRNIKCEMDTKMDHLLNENNQYSITIQQLQEYNTELNEKINVLDSEYSSSLSRLQSIEAEIEDSSNMRGEYLNEIQILKKNLCELNENCKQMDEIKIENESKIREISQLKAEVTILENKTIELKEIIAQKEDNIKEKDAQITQQKIVEKQNIVENLNEIKQQCVDLQETITLLEKNIAEKDEIILQQQKTIESIQKNENNKTNLNETIVLLEKHIKESEEKIQKQIMDHKDLLLKVSLMESIQEQLEKNKMNLEAEQNAQTLLTEKLKLELEETKGRRDSLIESHKSEMITLKNELSKVKQSNIELDEVNKRIQQQLENATSSEDLEKMKINLQNKNVELEQANKTVQDKLSALKLEYEELVVQNQLLLKNINTIQQQMQKTEIDSKEIKQQCVDLQETITLLEKNIAEKDEIILQQQKTIESIQKNENNKTDLNETIVLLEKHIKESEEKIQKQIMDHNELLLKVSLMESIQEQLEKNKMNLEAEQNAQTLLTEKLKLELEETKGRRDSLIESHKSEMITLKNELSKVKQSNIELDEVNKRIQQQLENATSSEDLEKMKINLQNKNVELEQANKTVQDKLSALKLKYEELVVQNQLLLKNINTIQQQMQKTEIDSKDHHDTLRNKLEALVQEKTEFQMKLEQLEDVHVFKVNGMQAQIEAKDKQLSDLNIKWQQFNTEKDNNIEDLTNKLKQYRKVQEETLHKSRKLAHVNDELQNKNHNLVLEINGMKRLTEKDRRSRRQSSHDEMRDSLFQTNDVETMTDPTDINCACQDMSTQIVELKRIIKIRDCQIGGMKMDLEANPLILVVDQLKRTLLNEAKAKDKLHVHIRLLSNQLLEKDKLIQEAKTIVPSSEVAVQTDAEHKILSLQSNDVGICMRTQMDELKRDVLLWQKKYEDAKKLCRIRKETISMLSAANTEKENECNNKNMNNVDIQNLESKYGDLQKENQELQDKYIKLKTVYYNRNPKVTTVNQVPTPTSTQCVQTDLNWVEFENVKAKYEKAKYYYNLQKAELEALQNEIKSMRSVQSN